jgi:hypothetical protein
MGRHQIVDKLNIILGTNYDFSKESEVVYLMVEVRKLIERNKNKSDYPRLWFYCSWVVHVCVDRKDARLFLKDVEADIKKYEEERNPSQFLQHTFFIELEKDLKKYLEENKISCEYFFKNKWQKSRKLLIKVLSECPALIKDPKDKEIESLVFDANYQCNISYEGGKRFSIDLKQLLQERV